MIDEGDARPPRGVRAAWPAATALLVAVALEAFLWAVTRVFVLNFSTAGPNATAGLAVLLVSGWTVAVVARAAPGDGRWALVAAALLVVGFAASLAADPVLAGVGAAVMLTAVTPLLVASLVERRERVVVGVAGGLLLWTGLRVVFVSASPYATRAGRTLYGAVVVAAAALAAALALRGALPSTGWGRLGTAPAPLGALLVAAPAFLASPSATARWALRSYEATVLALAAGLVVGLLVVHTRPLPTGPRLPAWAGGFLLGVGAVLYGSGPATTAALGGTWAAAVVLLAAGSRRRPDAAGTGAAPLVAVQALSLVALFGYVAASNWAFMPAPLDATRGYATEFLLALHAPFALSVLLSCAGGNADGSADGALVAGSRRSLLGALATAAVPLVSLLARDRDPAPDASDDDRIRVMAYNLHLFFEDGRAGRYNLAALRSVIADSGADVIAVSESDGCRPLSGNVDGLRWLGRALDYHVEFGAPTRTRGYGVGLLSRWPIESVRVVELPVSRSPPRLAVAATVRAPTGPLPVVATHFMTPKPGDVRDRQAEAVVDLARAHERAVVLGDFNVEPDPAELAYRTLSASLTDAWAAAERRRGGPETFNAADPRRRIDYVWLRGEWTVHEAAVLGSARASDHLAVLAEIAPR